MEELIKNNFIITENAVFKPIQLYNKNSNRERSKNNRVLFKSNNENIYVNVLNEMVVLKIYIKLLL